jgi:hypothetical protein
VKRMTAARRPRGVYRLRSSVNRFSFGHGPEHTSFWNSFEEMLN